MGHRGFVEKPAGNERELSGWTRERLSSGVLFLLTAAAVGACFVLVRPFVAPLTWALALAVVAFPVHRWLERRMKRHWAAALSLVLVAVVIVAPAYFVIQSVSREVATGVEQVKTQLSGDNWKALQQKHPWIDRAFRWVESQINLGQAIERSAAAVSGTAMDAVRGSVRGLIEVLVMFFFLFFLFRDRAAALAAVKDYLPMSDAEIGMLFRRISDAIYATINGTIVVGLVQGVLGGLMFWWLSLPAPFLWGTVMAVLSFVPVLGAFLVWLPAAIVLALQGSWVKAIVLSSWGALVIGLIDNILYPVLVGKRIALHTVPVFIALVGGVMLFGASGLILGPVIVAGAIALLEIWRQRTGIPERKQGVGESKEER